MWARWPAHPPCVLSECITEHAPVLAHVFSRCLSYKMTSSWKHDFVHPAPQREDCSDSGNTHPNPLFILHWQIIMKHLECCNLQFDQHYKLHMAYSTVIFFLTSHIYSLPLFGIRRKHLSYLWTYAKPWSGGGVRHYWPNRLLLQPSLSCAK